LNTFFTYFIRPKKNLLQNTIKIGVINFAWSYCCYFTNVYQTKVVTVQIDIEYLGHFDLHQLRYIHLNYYAKNIS
jgi:hypothetical protein